MIVVEMVRQPHSSSQCCAAVEENRTGGGGCGSRRERAGERDLKGAVPSHCPQCRQMAKGVRKTRTFTSVHHDRLCEPRPTVGDDAHRLSPCPPSLTSGASPLPKTA